MSQVLDSATLALASSLSPASSSGSADSGSQGSQLDRQGAKAVNWMLQQYASANGGSAFASTGAQPNVSA